MTRLSLLRGLLAFSIVSTALHYTHNFVRVSDYPGGFPGDTGVQVAIVVFWPLLTAVGLLGYRLYREGRWYPAHVCLAVYSLTGITTLGHFLAGNPDIPPFFYATIFTDGLAGLSILGFVVVSALRRDAPRARRRRAEPRSIASRGRRMSVPPRGGVRRTVMGFCCSTTAIDHG